MPSSQTDLSFLFSCEKDSTFIISCYETLLNRTIDPHELRHAIQMFKNGLSRGGFIYWVSRSPEFKKRFEIKNIEKYRTECYLYKIGEKVKFALKLDKKSPIKLKFLPLTNNSSMNFSLYKSDNSLETEYSALSTGQIFQLESYIPTVHDTPSYVTVGYMAQDIIKPDAVSLSYAPTDFNLKTLLEKHDFFITSPETIFHLLTTNAIEKLTQMTQEYLVFTMPVLPTDYNSLSIVWDNHWDNYEVRTNGSYERWMKGNTSKAGIHIINHSESGKHVSITFTLSSLAIGSAVILGFSGQENTLVFKDTLCPVYMDLWLNPGYNEITFTYFGSKIVPPGDWSRAVEISVTDFQLEEHSDSPAVYCKKSAYDLCEDELGSGYYPFLLTDPYIRSQLHKNGYFQVESYRLFSTYAVQKCAVTRYYHSNDERSLNCYYIFEEEEVLDNTNGFSSLMLYVARRTAPFNPIPFEFIRPINS
ncbi:hypothetical protein C0033_08640 [Clostridium sp. chh4-2]|uniref:DUF4214 domain-containing protein n=1 Tax=Clostridium sp. chh4-2 TaxID=2067550 RepID=UPI000CCF1998|nr:DUF4214 domain-containing protein [Clostridium sp. chh4-2]PNV62615.1 hypothetical protein C0033_08640 [Clostridium sp. chh4-2]